MIKQELLSPEDIKAFTDQPDGVVGHAIREILGLNVRTPDVEHLLLCPDLVVNRVHPD